MKKVLIVSRRLTRKDKLINWVSEVYLQLLQERGVMPIIVPIAEATKILLDDFLVDYDGLIMMEGGDIAPMYYGKNYNLQELDEFDPLKDEIEVACLRHAIANNKSVLGFCRGMQLINVLYGGTIEKDVHEKNNKKVMHIDYSNYDKHRHLLQIQKESFLYEWYKEEELMVNSYHHQGIELLGENLEIMAVSDDKLIEGICDSSKRFLVGLQFHPERMLSEHIGNYKVFDAFVDSL